MNKKFFHLCISLVFALAVTSVDAQQRINSLNTRNGRTVANPAATAQPAAGAAKSDARASGVEDGEDEKPSDIYIPAGTDLDIALKIYSQLIGKTVLRDPGTPDAKITLVSKPGQQLTKEDQIQALEAVFEMNGIHIEPYGDKFVRTMARDKARGEVTPIIEEEADIPDVSKVFSVMISFKNIPIDEAKTVLEGLKSPKGLLLVYERIGKILVTDTGLNINSMRKIAREIDVATPINENVFVRKIEYASAGDIQTALQKIVDESMKALEKASNAQKNGTQDLNNNRNRYFSSTTTPSGSVLRRPGQPNTPANNQPAQPANVESLVTSVSDADRGMIRGKVLITADERSNKLIIITSQTNMDFFDKVIEQLDVPTTPDVVVNVVRLKYAEAEDVSDMINDLIGNASSSKNDGNKNQASRTSNTGGNLTRGTTTNSRTSTNARSSQSSSGSASKAGELSKENCTVLADKRINGLVVMAHKDVMPTVLNIIESMDVRLSQVLIETVIIEVGLDDTISTGIDWVHGIMRKGKYYNQGLAGGGGTTSPIKSTTASEIGTDSMITRTLPSNLTTGGAGITYSLFSGKLNLGAVIQASKTDSHSKYLASPVVMTVDNKEATIEATSSRQFLSGWQAQSSSYSGSGLPAPTYSAKDIGITIKVTPKINPNGTVMLEVEEEYSQVSGQQEMLSPQGTAYVTTHIDIPSTRKMSADILLENSQSVVLGGLTESKTTEKESGIPILKDIPYIGKYLFGSTSHVDERKELLIFMTPYVLNDGDMAQAEALRRKNALSDPNPWSDNGWSGSELADPVSQKEILRRTVEDARKRDEDRKNKLAIEKWKLDRAKELERMSAEERQFWLEQHKDEIILNEDKKAFDNPREDLSQEMLQELADSIRERQLKEADAAIAADANKQTEPPKPTEEVK